LIASKFVETRAPALSELCLLCQNAYNRADLRKAELDVLHWLGWQLYVTTPHAFLEQWAPALNVTELCCERAEFFIDMACYEAATRKFLPEAVAAAALLLSCEQCNPSLADGDEGHPLLPELVALCTVDAGTLARCRDTMLVHFHSEFPSEHSEPSSEQDRSFDRNSPSVVITRLDDERRTIRLYEKNESTPWTGFTRHS